MSAVQMLGDAPIPLCYVCAKKFAHVCSKQKTECEHCLTMKDQCNRIDEDRGKIRDELADALGILRMMTHSGEVPDKYRNAVWNLLNRCQSRASRPPNV